MPSTAIFAAEMSRLPSRPLGPAPKRPVPWRSRLCEALKATEPASLGVRTTRPAAPDAQFSNNVIANGGIAGIFVAVGDTNDDGRADIFTGENRNGDQFARLFNANATGTTFTQTFAGPNQDTVWNITGTNSGTLTFGSTTLPYSASHLQGGRGSDRFVFQPGGSEVSIDGGGGTNQVIVDTSAATADPPPPEPARVRVIHAAFDPGAALIGVSFDGADPQIGSLAYEFASAYVELPAGTHPASLRANDAELIGANLDLPAEGGWYTAIAYSTADFPAAVQLTTDSTDARLVSVK